MSMCQVWAFWVYHSVNKGTLMCGYTRYVYRYNVFASLVGSDREDSLGQGIHSLIHHVDVVLHFFRRSNRLLLLLGESAL